MKNEREMKIARMLGLGFDNDDGHVRITQGSHFNVVDGSEATHARMLEICVKINDKLDRLGKRLEDLSPEEFIDLVSDFE